MNAYIFIRYLKPLKSSAESIKRLADDLLDLA